jgi:hypothetical protein
MGLARLASHRKSPRNSRNEMIAEVAVDGLAGICGALFVFGFGASPADAARQPTDRPLRERAAEAGFPFELGRLVQQDR